METTASGQSLFRKHFVLPQDHGSWVFLFTPLAIGLFAGRRFTLATLFLIIGVLAAFLLRQPLTIAVKVFSGRRSRRDLPTAYFWMAVYGAIGLLSLVGLVLQGNAYLLWLLIPGALVFAWHLFLVSRRSERRQLGVELVATGVLALAAPAMLWVARGYPDPEGWWLWAIAWLQAAASLVYAYLRLAQREWKSVPPFSERLAQGRRAILYASFNLAVSVILAIVGYLPALLPAAFAVQFIETIWGSLVRPAVRFKPITIGMRQLVVTLLFTAIVIFVW